MGVQGWQPIIVRDFQLDVAVVKLLLGSPFRQKGADLPVLVPRSFAALQVGADGDPLSLSQSLHFIPTVAPRPPRAGALVRVGEALNGAACSSLFPNRIQLSSAHFSLVDPGWSTNSSLLSSSLSHYPL